MQVSENMSFYNALQGTPDNFDRQETWKEKSQGYTCEARNDVDPA